MESGFADALTGCVSLTVGFTSDALDTDAIVHVVSSVADASSNIVAVAVGRTSLLHTFVSLSLEPSVAHAGISNLLTVVWASVGVGIQDAGSEGVAGVARRTDTEFAIVDFVITRATGGLVAVELGDLVDELGWTEDVSSSQAGSHARTSNIGVADLADATIA